MTDPADLTPDQREVLLGMPAPVREWIRVPLARNQAHHCGLTVEAWRGHARTLCAEGLAESHELSIRPGAVTLFRRTEAGDALAAQLEGEAPIDPGFAIPDLEGRTDA